MKLSTKLMAPAIAALALFFTTNVSAQDSRKFGIGLSLGVPTTNLYNFAIGADARMQFDVTKRLSIPVAAGYNHYIAKDNVLPDYGYIPVKTGLKYFFDPSGSGLYAMGEVGAAFGVTSRAKTTFLYAPTVGYSWSNGLDLGVRYENTGKGVDIVGAPQMGQVALRIAYGFKL
ncbi:hypothetical protein [Pedobacter sp. JCM 36344]|uniref:hypothetical protein n=1 Tax=Pedobacter sp. JCM 36344 TaxID=3374280 RepID=UPI003978927C